MAIKKIFVNPGDIIIMHIIDDPELPKNKREWSGSKPHPYKTHFTAHKHAIVFHDPGVELYMQIGTNEKLNRIY